MAFSRNSPFERSLLAGLRSAALLQGALTALLFEERQQLVYVFGARAKVHRINAKPRFPLQLSGREPELPALFDSPRNLRV
jgi:hypothetical protein